MATGPKSKKVSAEVSRLVAALGPELRILTEADPTDIRRVGGSLLAEAVTRLRRGQVRREAGYDGEYGVVALFGPGELDRADALFDLPDARARSGKPPLSANAVAGPSLAGTAEEPGTRQSGRASRGIPAGSRGPVLAHAAPPAFLSGSLDPDQRAAVAASSPLMIIAGPGTGKTRTLTHRIARELTGSGTPRPCLAITFTRRAAEEMRARLAAMVPGARMTAATAPAARTPDSGPELAEVTVTTFHGLGLTILREYHERAGLTAGFRVADDTARQELAAELTGSARDGARLLAEAAGEPAARAMLVKALAERDLVDFDGLIELPAALLAAEPGIAGSLSNRWPLINVDEYQDIDQAQYRLLRMLAGDGRGLTVIGDPDQAIYGFRGADVSFFLRFGRDYPGAQTRQLTRNYRSSGVIVAAAIHAIQPATLVPGRVVSQPGTCSSGAAPPAPSEHLWLAGAAAALVGFHQAEDERGEAGWIAREIERLLGAVSFHSLDTGRAGGHGHDGLGLSDVAVLYRTDAQAEPLGQALTRAGLPFQKGSHDLLERRTGVWEIVREMRLASPGGRTAFSKDSREDMQAGGVTVAARLRRVTAAIAARHGGTGSADGGPAAVDAWAAGEILAPLARRCGSDLERFLTEISLGAEADALDPRADAVTLLTLHAAKGLEFGVVFIAGCEKGLLPLWVPGRATLTAAGLAEERRLLFVGMTRARARLYLSCARRRTRHGSSRETGPSPFLAAIDQDLLDRSAARAGHAKAAARQLRLL